MVENESFIIENIQWPHVKEVKDDSGSTENGKSTL